MVLATGLVVVAAAATVIFLTSPAALFGDSESEQVSALSTPVTEDSGETERPQYEDGGAYREADVGFPRTLNPLLAQSTSERTVASLLFRGLLMLDSAGNPQPDLASEWSVSDDGLRYEVTLDTSVRWHDGEPVGVEDVLFTVSLVQDPEFPGDQSLSRFWRGISVERAGESSVAFRLMEPYAGFPNYLVLPLIPKHIYAGSLPADLLDAGLDSQVVGTGPYALSEVDEDRRELHFSAAVTSGISSNIDEVIFAYFDSRDEAMRAFRDGAVDGVAYVPLSALSGEGTLPAETRVYAPALPGYTALFLNNRHPLFRDPETRRAIEHAINREQLIDTVFAGHAIAGSSPIPSMLSGFSPGNHATFDRDRARDLLKQAGWATDGDDGTLRRDGERFVVPLLVNVDDPQRMAVADVLRAQLEDMGIRLEIEAVPEDEIRQKMSSRQFAAALFGWHTETGDPDCFQMWHSSQADEGMNFTGFSDPDADEALLAARRAVDLDERDQYYAEFQRVFAEQVPAVVLFYPRYHFAVSARVHGAEPVPLVNPSDRVRQIPKWYLGETSEIGPADEN
jgi:peptide/nickel transport system substrate-binding protein